VHVELELGHVDVLVPLSIWLNKRIAVRDVLQELIDEFFDEVCRSCVFEQLNALDKPPHAPTDVRFQFHDHAPGDTCGHLLAAPMKASSKGSPGNSAPASNIIST
jgi:hypothetical protein